MKPSASEQRMTLSQIVAGIKGEDVDVAACTQKLVALKCLHVCGSGDVEQLTLARDVFEVSAFLCVYKLKKGASTNSDDFERHINMLMPYYTDYRKMLPESVNRLELVCLYLLNFLASERIGELHMAYELLPLDAQQSVYIRNVMRLEQHLMDGSFNVIMRQTCGTEEKPMELPASAWIFLSRLAHTVRLLIAAALERAYTTLPCAYALSALHLNNLEELKDFCFEQNIRRRQSEALAQDSHTHTRTQEGVGSVSTLNAGVGSGSFACAVAFERQDLLEVSWNLQTNANALNFAKDTRAFTHCSLHSSQVAQQLIGYATELERIV